MTKPIKTPQTVEEAIADVLDRDDARLIAELRDSLKATRESRIKAKAEAFRAWVLDAPQEVTAKAEDFGGWVLTDVLPPEGTVCVSWRTVFDPDSEDSQVWIANDYSDYQRFATHPLLSEADEGEYLEFALLTSLIAAIKAKGWEVAE